MNTITSTGALSAHVRGYAEAVRLHLADLGPDVAEDLTEGLEADLTEAVLDSGGTPEEAAGTQAFDLVARFRARRPVRGRAAHGGGPAAVRPGRPRGRGPSV